MSSLPVLVLESFEICASSNLAIGLSSEKGYQDLEGRSPSQA